MCWGSFFRFDPQIDPNKFLGIFFTELKGNKLPHIDVLSMLPEIDIFSDYNVWDLEMLM